MKTDELMVSQDLEMITDTLNKIEWIALYAGMTRKDAASTRLLAEELLSATKDILDAHDSRLWMETSEEAFTLHLRLAKPSSKAERDRLIALSKDGRATPPKGLFARLGLALEKFLLLDDVELDSAALADYALFCGSQYGLETTYTYHYIPMELTQRTPAHEKPKDELEGIEKSIIDALVDDILVMPKSDTVEIIAVKKLK